MFNFFLKIYVIVLITTISVCINSCQDSPPLNPVPFTFELTMVNEHQFYIEVINGQNKIKFDQIEFGHDIKTGNDTFVIHLTPYDAVLKGIYEHNRIYSLYLELTSAYPHLSGPKKGPR